MVARGRGKKAASGSAAAAVAVAASESEAIVSNGDASQETETSSSEIVSAIAPTKKGRQRGVKKDIKDIKEEVDETPPPPQPEVVEKPTKPSKATKGGSKKAAKGKAAVVAEEEEKATIPIEVTKEEVLSENDSVEAKAIIPEKKAAPIRKRKVENIEKLEDVEAVAKKAPRVTKTKGAKKETVDSEGIPEDPAAAAVSITVLPPTQTNGAKKPSSRKRAAPVAEESIPEEPIKAEEPEQEVAPVKKGSKSKSSKKEPKEPKEPKETKKSAPKTKASKKAQKVIEEPEEEEEAAEHDVLPEDEFVPEIEEEEEELPKPKKVVKSKGSRKQVIPSPGAIEEEKIPEPIIEDEASEPQESEADSASASAIDEEQQQPTKSKGKKAPAAKKEKAPAKKASSKKEKAPKGKKPATKDESQDDQQQKQAEDEDENLNIKNNEENQDAAADVETSKRKVNGTAKPAAEPAEKKAAGRGRKRAAPEPVTKTPIDETNKTEKKPARGRKRAAPIDEAAPNDDETDGAKIAKSDGLFNPTKTVYNSSDFTLDKEFNMKICSWNIAGLRAWLKKDGLAYLQHEQPDILCLQEIKCTPEQLPEEARIPGYHPYWLCMPGGHAGVAVYSKIMPINVEYGIGNVEHDDAGRLITAEYEKFYLLSVYVPNSGRKLVNLDKRMQWEELFRQYVQKLEKVKPVIIAGDMNVSHKEIDLANPKTNTKSAGFTPQERDAMTKFLALGYVDTFRHFYPDKKGAYTYWTYMGGARSKNVGWRLDYFILSERIISKAVESTIRPQVLGSDHCPITLFLNI
ncbi:recombination repair protein 1 isoform X3 [Episyrphus balteatus]|uniref:recombination repair protein 1 isoform X3 n=1 Tax=Episyrphus balteatus TaxID=286459 RepID=UPI0024852971|nr:recombination repair protein 1 isoform X3 [Episyrphus balteatus]